MSAQYTQVRIKPVGKYQMKEAIRHDLRTKKEERAINDNVNYLWVNGEQNGNRDIYPFQRYEFDNDQNVQFWGNHFVEKLDGIHEEHKKLYRKTHKQSLNIERTKSLAMGILTFSDSFTALVEQDPYKMMEKGVQTIKDMAKELDCKLHYVAFHTDEKGIPHFQFFINNFNSQGKSIRANRSKEIGEKLQDMSATHFAEYGFIRGISKEKSGRKHLSIEEYKEYMELKDKQEELKESNLKLQEEVNQLREDKDYLKKFNEDIRTEINNTLSELFNELNAIENEQDKSWYITKIIDLVSKGQTKKLAKMKEKVIRHKDAINKKMGKSSPSSQGNKSNSSPNK